MRRLITAAVLVAALTSVSSASAITFGTADGSAHPNVGGLVAPTAYSDGTWIYCSGTLISPTVFLTAAHCAEASDQRPRHLLLRLPGRRQGLHRHLPRRPALQQEPERPARHRGRRPRQGRQGHRARAAARGELAVEALRVAAVHLGRLRRLRGDERPRRPPVPLQRRPRRRDRHAQHDHPELAEDLHEPVPRRRRHVLRRLGRPELPRDDEHRGRDDDHRRRRLPLDERGLPAGHGVGAGLPRQYVTLPD